MTTPINEQPSVKVGGKPYFIRFANGAFYLLSTWGIDVTAITTVLNERFREGRYTDTMYCLAAAALGTYNKDGEWETLGITPLKLADKLLDGESAPLIESTWKEFAGKLGLVTTKTAAAPAQSADSTASDGASSGPSVRDEAA